MNMAEALAEMSTGKLVALGIFGILALVLIAGIIVGTAAVLGPGMTARRETRPERKRMPVSTRVMGFGIVFLAIGLGVMVGIYSMAEATFWGIVGVILLSGGIGLILFYLIVSREDKQRQLGEDVQPLAKAE